MRNRFVWTIYRSQLGFLIANKPSRSSGLTNFTNSIEHFLRFIFVVSRSLLLDPRPLPWRRHVQRWLVWNGLCVGSTSGWFLASDLLVPRVLKPATSLRLSRKDCAKPIVSAEAGAVCCTARLHSWQRQCHLIPSPRTTCWRRSIQPLNLWEKMLIYSGRIPTNMRTGNRWGHPCLCCHPRIVSDTGSTIIPGSSKKNSHATWQASNSCSPLQPPLQSCNWKGVNVPNMNACFFWRPMGTTRKKQLWSWGARGDPTLESTVLSDGCFLWRTRTETKDIVSLCQRYFLVRPGHWLTLGQKMQNIMVAIWITNWTKEVSLVFVTGAALWHACCSFARQVLGFGSTMPVLRGPAMQLTCNTHATHSQHNTQHEHVSCKFSMNVRISRGWPRLRSLNANIRFLHTTHVLIENLQEKCSCCVLCCVLCWLCVACVLHVSCMAGPRNTGIVLPKLSTCHAKEQHACQSAAPVTNTSETSFVQFVIQIATMIFCIFCPNVSQCPGRTKK